MRWQNLYSRRSRTVKLIGYIFIYQRQLPVPERGATDVQRGGLSRADSPGRFRIALGHSLAQGALTIQDFEALCPGVHRRTLQRELKAMVDKGILIQEGSTNRLLYRPPKPNS